MGLPSSGRRYFDWAATALPAGGSVPEAGAFGNPSSLHAEGRGARESLERARSRCAAALGVKPENLYFSSGGTESNAIAVFSQLFRRGSCLFSAVEHPSVRENCRVLERLGRPVGVIPVESGGWVSEAGLVRALEKQPDARFAAIMAVNNETGALNDMAALSAALRQKRGPSVHLHCDLVQALGKAPVDISAWDLDSASLSAHKLGGPRGIGILYLKKPLETLYRGGGQEGGIRPGTENTAGALAMAACLEEFCPREGLERAWREAAERLDRLIRGLESLGRCRLIPSERRAGGDRRFSPYILQAAFSGVPGEVMARALDQEGFAVSTGSACSSSKPERPVLEAMGVDPQLRLEGIRISQGRSTSPEDIDLLIRAAAGVLEYL
ncbi:MAG: cysteine desulfurase [Treponema sp.]|jgi:cysteine desulfurase|nr:cysteine desulfurase [Treponema sp.]